MTYPTSTIICAKSSATALVENEATALFKIVRRAQAIRVPVSLQEEEAEKEIVSAGNQRLVITGPPGGMISGSQS